MSSQPIDIHYAKMKEWLTDRASLFGKKHQKELDLCVQLAPTLVQAAKYDVPALKKTIARLTNQRAESVQSLQDTPRVVQQQLSNRLQLLATYGIDGAVLDEGTASLEMLLDERITEAEVSVSRSIAQTAPSLLPKCFAMYNDQLARIGYVCNGGSQPSALHFPWLSRVVEEAALLQANALLAANKAVLDADVAPSTDATPDAVPDIDWGDDDVTDDQAAAAPSGADDAARVVIQWDEAEEPAPGDAAASASASPAAETEVAFPPPKPSDGAPSVVIARADHRSNILQEIHAMSSFLEERMLNQMEISDIPQTPENRRIHCSLEVQMATQIGDMGKMLTEGSVATLLRMRINFRLKEKVLNAFDDLTRAVSRANARAASSEQRIAAVDEELQLVEPQLEALIANTKANQRRCEEALQRVFPDRDVFIVGDINSL